VAPNGNPPVEWSEQQNIRWKTRLPGIGYSTPAIWGNTIFVTASIELEGKSSSGEKRKSGNRPAPQNPVKCIILAIDRSSGKTLWERVAREEIPHEAMHPSTTWATGSPITDGKYVFAYFGSRGLYCYDSMGNLQWEKDFGNLRIFSTQGEGATPALHKDRLIVNWDHEDQSFITVLDAATGREIWKKNRDEGTTWCTPLVMEVDGRAQVITNGMDRIRAYDLASGDLLWEDAGFVETVIPSPVAADGVVYLTGGYQQKDLRAIRLSDARGNIGTSSAILWTYNQAYTPFVPSPLLMDGHLYFLRANDGFLTCLDVSSGKPHYENQRLKGVSSVYASPVGVDDRVYIISRKGVTVVLRHGLKYEVLAMNNLDDNFDASPAIIGNEIYLRGHQYLYCISKGK
jgi:outer membrane protein assembly factor BamB